MNPCTGLITTYTAQNPMLTDDGAPGGVRIISLMEFYLR
jgi:hypothetical protein